MVSHVKFGRPLFALLLTGISLFSACGGGSSSVNPNGAAPLSGNWQFTFTPNQSFLGGLQGGFLLQNKGSVNGAAVYAISFSATNTLCNSGSAPITGTVSGQNVTLTAAAAGQTFTLTGTLSSDGTTMTGTYTSTDGPTVGGVLCGTAQSGVTWTATSVPPLTGNFRGNFHSVFSNQNFPVTGMLTQGENIGASNATVTGTLNFVDPVTLISNYPCFDVASVNGQISGNVVILQIIASNGANIGQIGGVLDSGVNTVTYDTTANGRVLHAAGSPSYALNTKTCPGVSIANPGDSGNICLALGGSNACQQPILLTPATLVFPPQVPLQLPNSLPLTQLLGSSPTTQTITLTNNDLSGSTLNGLSVNFQPNINNQFPGMSDFTGLPNFSEQDNCASSPGMSFSLLPGQSCSINVTFNPQQSCPWLPFGSPPTISGASPASCPFPLTASVVVNSPSSVDSNTTFTAPITGFALSAIQPSTPELDFGAQAVSEKGPPQMLTFTNQSVNPVQILGGTPCVNSVNGINVLPRPLQFGSPVPGLQVVVNGNAGLPNITPDFNFGTIDYFCDIDAGSSLPNFQISGDTCSGTLLAPQASCSVQISFAPQPTTLLDAGLDFFLELNTVQCTSSATSDCEIDSGRFPVELKANPPSPLRMTPSASLDFGTQTIGDPAFIPVPQTVTLFNDPSDPNSAAVNFVGRITASGPYLETDTCPFSLAPGASCVITVTFNPKNPGLNPGSLTINYTPEPTGLPQKIFLRGIGQQLFQ